MGLSGMQTQNKGTWGCGSGGKVLALLAKDCEFNPKEKEGHGGDLLFLSFWSMDL